MIDYKNLTRQDIVNMVWQRLNDGTGRAYDNVNKSCAYMTKSGNKCAVGIFLPDVPELNSYNGGISRLLRDCEYYMASDLYHFLKSNSNFFIRLQQIHDNPLHWNGPEFHEGGKKDYKQMCQEYNLKFPGDLK